MVLSHDRALANRVLRPTETLGTNLTRSIALFLRGLLLSTARLARRRRRTAIKLCPRPPPRHDCLRSLLPPPRAADICIFRQHAAAAARFVLSLKLNNRVRAMHCQRNEKGTRCHTMGPPICLHNKRKPAQNASYIMPRARTVADNGFSESAWEIIEI